MSNEIVTAYKRLVDSYTFTNPPRCASCKRPQHLTLVDQSLNGATAILKFKCFHCGDLMQTTVSFKPDGTYTMKWDERPQFSV